MTSRGWLVLALALLPLGVASALRAEPPAAAPSRDAGRPPAQALRQRLEQLQALHAATSPSGSAQPPRATAAPRPSASSGSPAAELAQKWADLVASRREHRDQDRAALRRQMGARLQDANVQAELALHAKRVAELQRLEFLARNARSGAQREQLLSRIAKLVERELTRHRKHLGGLAPVPSASSASSATSVPPAPGVEAPR